MKDYKLKLRDLHDPETWHWVPWGTGTPKGRDEVNRREVCECDGSQWVCDLDTIGVPSILRLIRIDDPLSRMLSVVDLRLELWGEHHRVVVELDTGRLRKLILKFQKHISTGRRTPSDGSGTNHGQVTQPKLLKLQKSGQIPDEIVKIEGNKGRWHGFKNLVQSWCERCSHHDCKRFLNPFFFFRVGSPLSDQRYR
jgi:hypothetical protein